ncbi:MAG: Crp/Fnr family transcriptional regulator [Cyanobacterium sp.]
METQEFAELFPLFHNLSDETLESVIKLLEPKNCERGETIISQNDWGSCFYLIASGWVKVQRFYGGLPITIEIIGKGGFVGEVGILSSGDFNSQVISISDVEMFTISAQRFIQVLFRDAQIQNRLLKSMVNKVIEAQEYYRFHQQTSKVRLVTILISLADKYGKPMENGFEIYNFHLQDLADLALLSLEECIQNMSKLEHKKLVNIDNNFNIMFLTNIKQLHHIIGQLGNE